MEGCNVVQRFLVDSSASSSAPISRSSSCSSPRKSRAPVDDPQNLDRLVGGAVEHEVVAEPWDVDGPDVGEAGDFFADMTGVGILAEVGEPKLSPSQEILSSSSIGLGDERSQFIEVVDGSVAAVHA